MNQRILINLRVGSIIVHWDESLEKRELSAHEIGSKQGHIVRRSVFLLSKDCE